MVDGPRVLADGKFDSSVTSFGQPAQAQPDRLIFRALEPEGVQVSTDANGNVYAFLCVTFSCMCVSCSDQFAKAETSRLMCMVQESKSVCVVAISSCSSAKFILASCTSTKCQCANCTSAYCTCANCTFQVHPCVACIVVARWSIILHQFSPVDRCSVQ